MTARLDQLARHLDPRPGEREAFAELERVGQIVLKAMDPDGELARAAAELDARIRREHEGPPLYVPPDLYDARAAREYLVETAAALALKADAERPKMVRWYVEGDEPIDEPARRPAKPRPR